MKQKYIIPEFNINMFLDNISTADTSSIPVIPGSNRTDATNWLKEKKLQETHILSFLD